MRMWWGFRILAAAAVLAGCTHVPFDARRTEIPAPILDAPSAVQRYAGQVAPMHGTESAFAPILDGTDALAARLRLIERAAATIDMQYFLLKPDDSGGLLARAIEDAADRGVRVRLLVDDPLTTASDLQLRALDHHANIEVRILNPLSRQSPPAVTYIIDFGRVNRRMHNKTFIVDGAFAIVGGRNIGNEYFTLDTGTEFSDYDILLAGPAARDVAAAFALFWDHRLAVPVAALHWDVSERELEAALDALHDRGARGAATLHRRAMASDFLGDLMARRDAMLRGPVRVVTDPPGKLFRPPGVGPRPVHDALVAAMAAARREVVLLSPYFVPRKDGVAFFAKLAESGVRVRIVTNSLASTNHPVVHAGYARHRKRLLAAGVELHEIRADAAILDGLASPASGMVLTMHSKAAVIDGRTVFVGSPNFDPRSIDMNTEIGVFVDSPAFAAQTLARLDRRLSAYAFRLSLTPDGRLAWIYEGHGRAERYTDEPGSGLLRRAIWGLGRILPLESHL